MNTAKYDIIVTGGGIAGVAAALAARRAGANRVLLLERQYQLGGLATCGLIALYLPLCDGMGRQVSFSVAEELLRLSIRHGAEGRYPSAWLGEGTPQQRRDQRFQVQFNPCAFAIDLEQLLLREGVELLYGVLVCGADTARNRLSSIEIVHKSGRETFVADAFVDATGDADLFFLAGAPTVECGQGNVLAAWYFSLLDGKFTLHQLGVCDTPDEYKDPEKRKQDQMLKTYRGLDARELTEMTIDAHHRLYVDFLQGGDIGPGRTLTSIASIPQVRMTRRLAGHATPDDKHPYAREETSVGMFADWRRRGAAYELPLGALQSPALRNVFAAGRCISVTDSMWDITRAIPACAVSGQAAGISAALYSASTGMDIPAVQGELLRQNAALHFKDLDGSTQNV